MLYPVIQSLVRAVLVLGSWIRPWNSRWALRARLSPNVDIAHKVWMHGASLGECRMLLQVARRLPQCPIVLTTQKADAWEALRAEAPAHVQVAIAPWDHPNILKRWWSKGAPRALVLGESDLWPGWLAVCTRSHVPVSIVSARFSEKAWKRWQWFGLSLLRKRVCCVQMVWAQEPTDARIWKQLVSNDRVHCTGDWKWLAAVPNATEDEATWEERPVDVAFISLHLEEWLACKEAVAKMLEMGSSVVFVPRFPQQQVEWVQRFLQLGIRCVAWPKCEAGAISLVSTYGQVAEVLKYSRLVVQGGSLWIGGIHNYREALAAGVPVVYGPFVSFCGAELKRLSQRGVVHPVRELTELCIGREGRDIWAPGWFPWEERHNISAVLATEKARAEAAFEEFATWLSDSR